MPNGSIHPYPAATDADLATQLTEHIGARTALQVVIELMEGLRDMRLPWWTPALRRAAWSAQARMRQLEARPDIRQRVMMALTQMPPRASRRLSPDLQASLIDEVLQEDVSVDTFEDAFRPAELVAYGDPAALVREVVAALPWDEESAAHREVFAIFMDSCLRERTWAGQPLAPLLTWWELRMAIDADAWQDKLPREVRVSVDRARLDLERSAPGTPFTARHELEAVGLSTVREHLPLRALAGIFTAALAKMDGAGGGEPKPRFSVPSEPHAGPLETEADLDAGVFEDGPMAVASESADGGKDDGLERIPPSLLPLEGEWGEDAQFCLVGGLPKEEIDVAESAPAALENPWNNDELTDPGLGGAEEPAPRRPTRTEPLRRRARPAN